MIASRVSRGRAALSLTMLAFATFGAAGCGSDDEPGRTATVGNSAPIEVVADEYSFDPEALIVQTGAGAGEAAVPIRLENAGELAHNLMVFEGDRELGGTPTFQGGETRSGRVRLKPGRYRMVCTVGNHEELGMTGTLEVSGDKPPAGG